VAFGVGGGAVSFLAQDNSVGWGQEQQIPSPRLCLG
jgi:hypothetical protein